MAEVCAYCGKKNSFFSGDPIYLDDTHILCHKCAEPIKRDYDDLYYTKTQREFYDLKDKVLDYCKKHFDDYVTFCISNLIDDRYVMVFGDETKNDKTQEVKDEIKPEPAYCEKGGIFCNAGDKLKSASEYTFVVFVIISIIYFIVSLAMLSENNADIIEYIIQTVTLILSIVGEFVACLCLYGFGVVVKEFEERRKNS